MPENNTDTSPPDTDMSPADAFALVGHEIRAEIIWELGNPENRQWNLSLGELRSRLDTDVEPSQLHYHLQQLVGHYVTKNDGGYQLRTPGVHLCWALRAGTFDRRRERVTVDAGFDCYDCQARVEAVFDDGTVIIECHNCASHYLGDVLDFPVEPFQNGVAAFSHLRKYMVLKTLFLARDVCPTCAQPLRPSLQGDENHPRKVCIHKSCSSCGAEWDLSLGRALLADRELLSFCYNHGVDVLWTPFWELDFAATEKHVTVRSTDPWELTLQITLDGDTLEFVVDGDLTVIERNHLDSDGVENVSLPNKDACLQSLRRQRWPEGVTCPHCDSVDTIKKGASKKDAQRYQCHTCNSTFTDLTGTIFAGRGISLPEMVHIIRKMNEMPTAQLAERLDRSYNSVLDFVHEVQDVRNQDVEAHSHEADSLINIWQ